MSSPASSLFLLYSGILLLFALNNTFPTQWPPLQPPTFDLPNTIITLVALSIPFLVALFQTNNEQIDPPPTPDLAELLVMWRHPIWAFRRLKANEALSLQHQNNGDTNPQAPDVNPDHGNATNQWLEQQLQSLHQEVTTLNAMTTRLAPPPIIPVPPASPQPLPPASPQSLPLLSPHYHPFQAWDDDHIIWENLEWKEDKYCGQVYCYAITGPDHAHCFVGIS
ncbi:hypothetical protein AMATHDRAFT_8892 [Amanita thiersii Skay4041]|uniref:Uncharacterized protein n=1 Tax=Amanita thiersii Skay4041 TaxID=703135 RepID=A0A2A9N7S2_9AGAR|nr:hypothetical protein AMATHDRAFT_8892 [Amanita thiersii Skay4041]